MLRLASCACLQEPAARRRCLRGRRARSGASGRLRSRAAIVLDAGHASSRTNAGHPEEQDRIDDRGEDLQAADIRRSGSLSAGREPNQIARQREADPRDVGEQVPGIGQQREAVGRNTPTTSTTRIAEVRANTTTSRLRLLLGRAMGVRHRTSGLPACGSPGDDAFAHRLLARVRLCRSLVSGRNSKVYWHSTGGNGLCRDLRQRGYIESTVFCRRPGRSVQDRGIQVAKRTIEPIARSTLSSTVTERLRDSSSRGPTAGNPAQRGGARRTVWRRVRGPIREAVQRLTQEGLLAANRIDAAFIPSSMRMTSPISSWHVTRSNMPRSR